VYPSANLDRFDLELLMFLLEQLSGKTLSKSKPPASDGEDAVRTKIQETLQEKRTSLNEFLKAKKKNITKLKNRDRLHRRHYELLYPTSADLETFDLTLLIQLFKVLSINAFPTSEPSGTDVSLEADLDRMRRMRNKIYGHVKGTGVGDDVFEQQWTTISSVLIRLGVKKKRISRWKRDAITTNDVDRFKKRLVEVMENDMGDMTALQHIILSEVKEGRLDIETLATQLKKNVEDCREMLRSLVTAVPPTKLLRLIQDIDADQHKNAETVKEIREMMDEVLRKLDMVNVKPETIYVQETPSLSEMSSIYENHPDAFKILIIGAPQLNQDQESLDRFCKAVGECKWNIVLDLDEHSRSSKGMFDRITPVFSKRTDYTVLTYEQIQARVKDDDKDMVAQGKLSLWILANGCSFSKCPPSTGNFSKVLTKFGSLLDNILDRTVQKPPVICTSIALSDAARQPMYRLTERINEICESAQQEINYEATSFIAVHTDGNAPRATLQDAPHYLHIEASMEQLTTRFENTFGTSCKEAKYWYPGQKDWCYMKRDEMAVLTSCMTLYHKDIGKAPFEALSTQEEVKGLMQSTKTKFLHGEKITPEALYINDTTQTFVKRREMRQLNENVAKLLEKRGNKLERPATSFNLFHDVSGGGTTCGRYLLYALKDTYPCIEIEEINSPKLLQGLHKIYYSSTKPLLIVIDDSKVSDDETATFVNRLNNDFIKALVVIIKPKINKFSTTRHGGTDRGFYVKSKVTYPEDLVAFKNLYDQNEGLNAQKVFLFGLLAFTEEYDKLNETVQSCYENSDEDQQRVLRLTCLLWKYSHKATAMKAVLKLMRSKDIFNEDDLIEALGSGSDLLVATGKGIRPAHFCIVKALMRCVDEDTLTSMFVTDLKVLVQKDTHKKRASNILHSIFIERTIEEHNYWSGFVLALINLRGKDYGASVIKQFIELMEGTDTLLHMKALFARYLMYNLDKPDDALNMAKEALILKPSDSVVNSKIKDTILLTTYGNLVRERVKRMFPKSYPGGKQVVTKQLLEKALEYIQEAICAYQEAQRLYKGTLYNARPFVMEARARYEVMSLFFIHRCNEDHIKFSDFIKGTSIDLLRESEEKAMDVLDRLDFFRKLDKIWDGGQESKTKQVELETKFDFLRLRTDKDSTIRKQILTIPSDAPCDIAEIVRCDKSHRRRQWKDLHMEELELIIKKLDERMTMPNALAVNYEGIINAMVCLRSRTKQADKYKKFNIRYAHQCAELWKRKFKHNFDAWFMHGVLTLLLGMEQHKVSEIHEALISLNKCREICRNRDSIEGYRGRRYIIGEGSGLEKLVPFSEADTVGKGQLELFVGRQINKAEIVVSDFEYTLKVKVPKSEDVSFTQQERLVQFNMVLARDNILAMNVEIYEREAD
ncbi:hypothetical protein LSAT2_020780, partial [Lamellibrachia satsuma]